ncbi:glyoxalase [Mycolicibacterium peregrinum]|uniref:Glyoxalase n=2 Tax=Mycolicibacterium peregrinum TaxID=43304 RepID=A0A1A0W7E1_MYCPR|nr:glyoxalase [Mycolicibacterium peregrinum]
MSLASRQGLTNMTMTTRVLSVSVPVSDQDAALKFYTEVLGCELRTDMEVWPGARMIEVVPPGSDVALVLLPHDSQIPIAIRLGTADAQEAHDTVRDAGVTLHNDELIRMAGVPAMFSFTDPDGNGLVYLEDSEPTDPR